MLRLCHSSEYPWHLLFSTCNKSILAVSATFHKTLYFQGVDIPICQTF